MKNIRKKKGYMLVETLIVSVTVTSILIYLYSQFTNVQTFYNEVYKYNNVNELYLTGTIKNLIISNEPNIYEKIDSNNFINICNSVNNCSTINVNSPALKEIISHYKVKNIILASANKSDVIKEQINSKSYSSQMKEFSKLIADQKKDYRIIVEFDDSGIATVLFDK